VTYFIIASPALQTFVKMPLIELLLNQASGEDMPGIVKMKSVIPTFFNASLLNRRGRPPSIGVVEGGCFIQYNSPVPASI
jgi:hypothetical protein